MSACENVALWDLDGTLCDYDSAMIRDLRKIMNPLEMQEWHGCVEDAYPTHGDDWPEWYQARVDMIRSVPGWWLGLKPLQPQLWLFDEVRRIGFDCHILTKGSDRIFGAWKEKVEWCKNHLGPDVKVTITQDKGLVYGKVLVDDYPKYITRWLEYRPRGLVIMPTAKYNRDFFHPNVIRFDGTEERKATVVKALWAAFNREAGESLAIDLN